MSTNDAPPEREDTYKWMSTPQNERSDRRYGEQIDLAECNKSYFERPSGDSERSEGRYELPIDGVGAKGWVKCLVRYSGPLTFATKETGVRSDATHS